MSKYRSAHGKVVDMAALAARNERVRAVGNMNVNARGDTIDSAGRVIVPVTKKVGNNYQKTVANKAAVIKQRKEQLLAPIETAPAPETKIDSVELTVDELEFEDTAGEDLEIEKIKAKETSKGFKIKPASEAPDSFDPTKD